MPCPKCGHLLITEDDVIYCEECLHVVARKDDSNFEEPPAPKPKPKPIPKLKPPRQKKSVKGKICSTKGCNKPVFAKGLCRNSYQRAYMRQKNKKKCVLCPKPRYAKKLCKGHFIKVYGLEYVKFDGRKD